ncbi:MAG: 16S rRNA (cytidine(1402)-2'-O)-methyltransferase [Nitrospirota bacterium]
MEPSDHKGTLYLVSTPIGHLEDITLRALRVLKEVDLIAAEDTRHTQKLLARYDIHGTLTSYHDFNKETKAPVLLARMLDGASVALVCDAGTPTISDPGYFLITRCIEAGVPVVPIPGPCAAIAALAASGLPSDRFHFEGFLPKPSGRLAKRLAVLRDYPETLVLYESPHRLLKTLKALLAAWGDRPAVIARELTKMHEECLRGTLSSVIAEVERRPRRGEITLLIGGCDRLRRSTAMTPLESATQDEGGSQPATFHAADQ